MSKNNLLLTISLLSSGRIGSIERCLASLAPIREKLETEVIVVDTDPEHGEDVHAILVKYADQIIPFDWCDDFSAARNAGLKKARGEWFLFVDDDEWFLDAEPLTGFLCSKERKEYSYANIMIRNYKDAERKGHSDTWISRLFRLEPGMRFVGRTHEYMDPVHGRWLNIEAVLGHTGYVYANDEEKKAHARRNLKGLEALMKEEPLEARWVFQAMGEYEDLGETEKQMKLAKKGYRLMKGAAGYQNALIRGAFASSQVHIHAVAKEWEECAKAYRRLMKGEEVGKVSRAQMELNAAQAAYYLGQKNKAKRHCEKYLEIYEEMTGRPVEYPDEYVIFQAETLSGRNHALAVTMLTELDLADGSWEAFDRYFPTVEWGGSGYGTEDYAKNLLLAASRCTYDGHFAGMAGAFWGAASTKKIVQSFLTDGMAQGAAEAGDPAYWNLVRAVAEADTGKDAAWDVRILWTDHAAEVNGIRGLLPQEGDTGGKTAGNANPSDDGNGKAAVPVAGRNTFQGYFSSLFMVMNPLLVSPEIWKIGLRRGALLDGRIREIPFDRWKGCVEGFVQTVTDPQFALDMAAVLEDVYLGLPDEHYHYFMARTEDMLAEAETRLRQRAEAQQQKETRDAAQKEMRQIIDALQKKVEELVSAGMIEEADKVLQEIQKYTDMTG